MNAKIQREMLDRTLRDARALRRHLQPENGWLREIRKSLGMPLRVVAGRAGMTPQAIQRIEKREAEGSVTLESLRNAAEMLDCDLVYAIVPKLTLENTLRALAEEAAKKMSMTEMQIAPEGTTAFPRKSREEMVRESEDNPRFIWNWLA